MDGEISDEGRMSSLAHSKCCVVSANSARKLSFEVHNEQARDNRQQSLENGMPFNAMETLLLE